MSLLTQSACTARVGHVYCCDATRRNLTHFGTVRREVTRRVRVPVPVRSLAHNHLFVALIRLYRRHRCRNSSFSGNRPQNRTTNSTRNEVAHATFIQ